MVLWWLHLITQWSALFVAHISLYRIVGSWICLSYYELLHCSVKQCDQKWASVVQFPYQAYSSDKYFCFQKGIVLRIELTICPWQTNYLSCYHFKGQMEYFHKYWSNHLYSDDQWWSWRLAWPFNKVTYDAVFAIISSIIQPSYKVFLPCTHIGSCICHNELPLWQLVTTVRATGILSSKLGITCSHLISATSLSVVFYILLAHFL